MLHKTALAVLVPATLLLPACGEDNLTLPEVPRAVLEITVEPNPVTGLQNLLTGSVSAAYRVSITERAGLGGEILFVSSQVYDPETGLQMALNYFDGADLVVFVGTKRIDPGGTLVVPQTTSYFLPEFRVPAQLAVNVQMKDDRENLINQSVLVRIIAPE